MASIDLAKAYYSIPVVTAHMYTVLCIHIHLYYVFLLRFYVYSSPVVELQENVNMQAANNLSQHTKNEHRFV